MRIPLTSYARRELRLYGTLLAAVTVLSAILFVCVARWFVVVTAFLLIVLLWLLFFFRDPARSIPEGAGLLVAPADGRVTEVAACEEERVGGEARRVSIFLSIFDAHLNRAPCSGRVVSVTYEPGIFLNAMNPRSARVNEANTVVLESDEAAAVPILVKQIAGIIARRIVCECTVGQTLARGELFGMIKFGSRTELCVPAEHVAEIKVNVGDHVTAGETVIGVLQ